MESDDNKLSASQLPSGRFSGRESFEQMIRDGFAVAAAQGWPEIIVSDATFSDWPLRERVVVESLNAWARSGRRFLMMASRFDSVLRQHPRFVTWRQTWGHIVECKSCPGVDLLDFPSAMWSAKWAMQRIDIERSVVICGTDPQRRTLLKQILNEQERNSSSAFPSSTLGL